MQTYYPPTKHVSVLSKEHQLEALGPAYCISEGSVPREEENGTLHG